MMVDAEMYERIHKTSRNVESDQTVNDGSSTRGIFNGIESPFSPVATAAETEVSFEAS